LQRIKNQITDEERKQKANYFILNNESVSVIQQVLQINALLLKKAEVNCSS
jgi:dephospho-CoA kinase